MGGRVGDWLRLVKFSHTLFALPFGVASAVWSLGLSGGVRWGTLCLIVLCMVFARNAAMGYNRLADRRVDGANPRTSGREIPRGAISPRAAGWFVGVNGALFVWCAGLLNTVALCLSPVALVLLLGYSHTKRFTMLCHFWLGATLGLAPVGAAVAIRGGVGWAEVLLGLGVMLWVAGFDMLYSLHDEGFDRSWGLHSAASRLGRLGAIRLARLCHVGAVGLLASALWGWGMGVGWFGLAVFAGVLLWQHSWFSSRNIERVDGRFMLVNGINSVVLSAGLIVDMLECQVAYGG